MQLPKWLEAERIQNYAEKLVALTPQDMSQIYQFDEKNNFNSWQQSLSASGGDE